MAIDKLKIMAGIHKQAVLDHWQKQVDALIAAHETDKQEQYEEAESLAVDWAERAEKIKRDL